MIKIKCNDGIVRRFSVSHYDGKYMPDGRRFEGYIWSGESECLECGEKFGHHDTKILKPIWRKHRCC